MSFDEKRVVVLGATGVVGSGVVRKYLDAGATVVGVSRSEENLEQLRKTVGIRAGEAFLPVVGDFHTEDAASATREAVVTALAGAPVDHVVSSLGFVQFAGPPTEAPIEAVQSALENGLYINVRAAKAFVPMLKGREDTSYTLVSGGLAHFPPPDPALWLGTLKNAAINAFTYGLASETAKDPLRVNTICIHFGVAPVGGDKNQFGMPSERDTLGLAPAFLGVAKSRRKGQVVCLTSWADADAVAAG
jgi:NAD(P)-dependent dehydrogenase (short-subunit alcohol dehydrogenase family)